MTWIGVDIGGSHIAAAQICLSGDDVSISNFVEADVDTFGEVNEIIREWSRVIRQANGGAADMKVGIAMPGPYDYENGVSLIKDQGKMKSLLGLSVRNLLAESLAIDPKAIVFTNDAEAFLLGESLAGAGRSFKNAIGLTLGTGLGSAIKIEDVVKDAKLWTAPFRDGIAEDYLGTSWFKTQSFQKFGLEIAGVKELLAKEFDSQVSDSIFAEFGRTLGEFLEQYIIRLHCQGVVLGGKIARASERFIPYTQAYLAPLHYPFEIKVSEMEEKATLVGACHPFLSESQMKS
ncbi:ROK family protein [Algoriphagus litoralis]|uniref:ROK family protein n=1 Tax=Algoriphagus litoralis TaxID=2202829 RepID=UPI000DB8FBD8|nr:ROK family protein [Algoriphagus litoralis]